jgi:hypothetical protein
MVIFGGGSPCVPLVDSEDSPNLIQGRDSSLKATTGIGFVLGDAHLQFGECVCYIVQSINELLAYRFVHDYQTKGAPIHLCPELGSGTGSVIDRR